MFLTAAVIMDDLVAIAADRLFYTEAIDLRYLLASRAVIGLLGALNRLGVYRSLPYALVGLLLWACLHGAGIACNAGRRDSGRGAHPPARPRISLP